MRADQSRLYTSAETYLNGPDGMRNEVDTWAAAGGLLIQERVRRYQGTGFGGLHEKIGSNVRESFETVSTLDVCCGPGNFVNYLSLFCPDIQVTGIDLNKEFLKSARERFGKFGWKFLERDATTFDLEETFDFVTASSAYHHIPDEKKVEFLRRIKEHLDVEGKVIMCEHFLPRYEDESARESSVHNYYDALEEHYSRGNATTESRKLIKEVRELELSRNEEQKVDYQRFQCHLKESGLEIEADRVIWQPTDFQEDNAGSHALLLRGR